jgi:hypothetical protein
LTIIGIGASFAINKHDDHLHFYDTGRGGGGEQAQISGAGLLS